MSEVKKIDQKVTENRDMHLLKDFMPWSSKLPDTLYSTSKKN